MKRALRSIALLACLMTLAFPAMAAFDHSHRAWNELLRGAVRWNAAGTASQVDYDLLARQHDRLEDYLTTLSAVPRDTFERWSRDEQLAFLINAYNAFTVELILSRYPQLDSIKDLGSLFSSPWSKVFFRLLGTEQTLDGIEHELIRGSGRYDEPLIHFAVNCASIGCPALRDEAFVAARLDEQLQDSTRRFLRDRSRNRFDAGSGTLHVSSIFDWYGGDFEQGWRGYASLDDFFRAFAADIAGGDVSRLQQGALHYDYLDYDWRLNAVR